LPFSKRLAFDGRRNHDVQLVGAAVETPGGRGHHEEPVRPGRAGERREPAIAEGKLGRQPIDHRELGGIKASHDDGQFVQTASESVIGQARLTAYGWAIELNELSYDPSDGTYWLQQKPYCEPP
jgi:hypothetical protein